MATFRDFGIAAYCSTVECLSRRGITLLDKRICAKKKKKIHIYMLLSNNVSINCHAFKHIHSRIVAGFKAPLLNDTRSLPLENILSIGALVAGMAK